MAAGSGSPVPPGLRGPDAENWAAIQEKQGLPLYRAALEELDLAPGGRMLDAGCGAGMALTLAAARGATVAGLDASEPMLAVARRRLPDAELLLGDLESLPWADGSFDAVTGFNSFQFAASPVDALKEARRVIRRRGTLLVAIWGPSERCQSLAHLRVIESLLPPLPPGGPGPFRLSAPGQLEDLFADAGLTAVSGREIACPFRYPDLGTALRGLLSSRNAARAAELHGRDPVEAAVARAIEPFRTPDGGFRIENVFRFVVGRA